jgi:hypothetical protein
MRDRRGAQRALVGKSEGERERPLRRTRRTWRIILKWIFKKQNGAWTELIWFRICTSGG